MSNPPPPSPDRFRQRPPARPPTPTHPRVVIAIVGLCAVIEAALTVMALPPFSTTGPRETMVMLGAFWPGLLQDWEPIFALQPVTMFLSYGFLHGGLLHMVLNMVILVALGREAALRTGPMGFLLFFFVTSGVGGAVYALLATSNAPMLGASGAVFGLFGAQAWWDIQIRRARRLPLSPVWRMIVGLIVMNVLLWFLVSGMLAWQTHLGGFLAGFVMAWFVTPTLAHRWRA